MACCKCCCEGGTPPGVCCGDPESCCYSPSHCCDDASPSYCCQEDYICCNGACCAPDEFCCGGVCQAEPCPCDPECSGCSECVDGNCVSTCAGGEYCCDGVCQAEPCVPPCDPPCDGCSDCIDGDCVSSCGEGQNCCDGACQDEPCVECVTNEDCGCADAGYTYYAGMDALFPGQGCCPPGTVFEPALSACSSDGTALGVAASGESLRCCSGVCVEVVQYAQGACQDGERECPFGCCPDSTDVCCPDDLNCAPCLEDCPP